LEQIVGIKLTDEMTDEQVAAFDKFFQARDDAGAFAWLTRNFPEYRRVVRTTLDELGAELRRLADEMHSAPGELHEEAGEPPADADAEAALRDDDAETEV
jgi:uncharacterized protein DUF5663